MKTIYVKFWSPSEVGLDPNASDEEVKKACFRAYKYRDEFSALEAYANTRCTWSALLEDNVDVKAFIDEAYEHIKCSDEEWLEANFT